MAEIAPVNILASAVPKGYSLLHQLSAYYFIACVLRRQWHHKPSKNNFIMWQINSKKRLIRALLSSKTPCFMNCMMMHALQLCFIHIVWCLLLISFSSHAVVIGALFQCLFIFSINCVYHLTNSCDTDPVSEPNAQTNNNNDLLRTHGPYRRHSKQRMSAKMVSYNSLQNRCLHMITQIGEEKKHF